MAIIGIDLGTTNSLACVWRKDQAELIPNAYNTKCCQCKGILGGRLA